MVIKGYCGKECSNCSGCYLDTIIPCSPDCDHHFYIAITEKMVNARNVMQMKSKFNGRKR